MSREIAARDIAGRLRAAEARIDSAVSAVADLAAALPSAGRRAGVSLTGGQQTLAHTAAALELLLQSRGRLGEAHRRLAVLARALGLQDHPAIGPLDKPEEDVPRGADPTPLRRAMTR